MIRINLSPLRRPKTKNRGQQLMLLSVLVWLAALVVGYVMFHAPKVEQRDNLQQRVRALEQDNRDKEDELRGYEQLKATISGAEARAAVVQRLNEARAVPAHMLFELSQILTAGGLPTMTEETRKQVEEGRVREFVREWDPSHLWLKSFKEEKDGSFRLEGAAHSDSDMTQFAIRLDASVYFYDVRPVGGSEATDKDSGTVYYNFTIVGKVAY